MLRVVSAPEGAEVLDASGHWVGTTNTGLIPVKVGDEYFFTMKKSGYRPFTLQGKVPQTVAAEPLILFASLENFSPPQSGEAWDDHLGNPYQPSGDGHVGVAMVTREVWSQFAESGDLPESIVEFIGVPQGGQPSEVVLSTLAEATAFCEWFRVGAYKMGFLTEDQEVVPLQENSFENSALSDKARQEGLKPFRVVVRPIDYGEIHIVTHPPGVEIYMNPVSDPTNRVSMGSSNVSLLISKVKPGDWQLYLVREGYKPLTLDVKMEKGAKMTKSVNLEKSLGVVFGKPWENGIGMRFAPLGQDLMVSIWETRVGDYERFVVESGVGGARTAYFPQAADHPVVNVSREDAQAFCGWLTERERKDERVAQTHVYRLPTDLEWSVMAGIHEEEGISPGWRDARKERIYPWGVEWPPPGQAGNFADVTASKAPGFPLDRTISGYDDGFDFTAPVGSFPADRHGLYDLSGNVQEWVEDEYSKLGKNLLGVLRGGGWNSYQSENLFSGSRNAVPPTFQDAIYGFRAVLAKVPPKPE
jgi:formylglycine-generating enzyme required for sulfatase activity